MTPLVAWLVFPLLLGLLSLGCGVALERATGRTVPGALLVPAGLAVLIVVAQFFTLADATAELATPAVAVLAAAGLALSRDRLRRLDLRPGAAAAAVYAVFAAPVVLSGSATFAGYVKLDDTATFLALTDRAMTHGRSLAGLAPSSYETTLAVNLAHGYPLGSILPLGVGHTLVGADSAWLYQPYLAFLAGVLALGLYGLLGGLVRSAGLRGLAAGVAAASALLYGYALWGGIKELAAAALLPLPAALVRERLGLPLAFAAAAMVGVLSLGGGAVWLVPLLVAGLPLAIRAFRGAALFSTATLVLSLPALLAATTFINHGNDNALTDRHELGNLFHRLSLLQAFGIWPSGDFRTGPADRRPAYVLVAVCALAAVAALAWARRRRAPELPLYLGSALAGTAVLVAAGAPWVGAKALAIASPAFLLAGAAGCAIVFESGRRIEAALAGAAILFGVVWSDALQYREVNLAPRGQLVELERIGKRFAGQGPTLMTEYSVYGVRHFLRAMDAEGASELRRRVIPLRTGQPLGKAQYADLDAFRLDGLLVYRSLVLRRSPVESRPPSVYRLVWRGRFYEVWQRPVAPAATVLDHLPLGAGIDAAGIPRCDDVLRLAALAGRNGRLAAVVRPPAAVVPLPGGSSEAGVRLAAAGRYGIWVGGSFRGRLQALVDGKPTGSARHRLNWSGQFTDLGAAGLAAGAHRVTLRSEGSDWRPGSAGPQPGFGPLVLGRVTADLPVVSVSPARARILCGKSLDWVEALRSSHRMKP